ncbi:hypothetical protein [Pedobacter sp. SYSU D00535]|uniref:hypothetical protein n=1 Tax=Pedobacter sp. SYSU D00535 TaxID=2810308 RepID=UPI001A967AB5|nr:hypothetical protein [Pedobacter sp. SYSU D00535]
MNASAETFTIWADLEGWSRNNFLVEPKEVNEEQIFKILTENEVVGVIHKTFEDTWESLEGNLTLQDSETLGEEIENYYNKEI